MNEYSRANKATQTLRSCIQQAATESSLLEINIELCRAFNLPDSLDVPHELLAILAALLPEFGSHQKRFWRDVKRLLANDNACVEFCEGVRNSPLMVVKYMVHVDFTIHSVLPLNLNRGIRGVLGLCDLKTGTFLQAGLDQGPREQVLLGWLAPIFLSLGHVSPYQLDELGLTVQTDEDLYASKLQATTLAKLLPTLWRES